MKKTIIFLIVIMFSIVMGLSGCGGGGGGSGDVGDDTPSWGTPEMIVDQISPYDASSIQLVVDNNGNALVAWKTSVWDGEGSYTYYTESTASWRGKIAYTGYGSMNVDGSGNIMSVWIGADGVSYSGVWSNRLTAGSVSWGTPKLIETGAGEARGPKVAVDHNGNALAVWSQWEGDLNNIWSNRYTAATSSWGTSEKIGTFTGTVWSLDLVIDNIGNAIAVWDQTEGPYDPSTEDNHENIWSNRYTASTASWGTPVLIETNNAGAALDPKVTADGNGNVFVVWYQYEGPYDPHTTDNHLAIWSNRYTAATSSWGTPEKIGSVSDFARYQQVISDSSGNALAVWVQGYDAQDLYSNRYNAASASWGSPELIEISTAAAGPPQLAVDKNGNALAVWSLAVGDPYNHPFDIWSNSYTAASASWGKAKLIARDGSYAPQVAVDGNGNGLAVWIHYSGGYTDSWPIVPTGYSEIWINRFE
jgi:hypothetical protein